MSNGIYTLEINTFLTAVRGNSSQELYEIVEERVNELDDDYWMMRGEPEILITSYNPDGSIIWQESWVWESSPEGRGYWFEVSPQ